MQSLPALGINIGNAKGQTKMKIAAKAGIGYWKLGKYPWGGDFARLQSDEILTVEKVFDTYKDGTPRKVCALLNGEKCGFTVTGFDVKVTE